MTEKAEQKVVHPTTDKTWRNATYDLTRVPFEAARVFYRTRLEVTPADGATRPWETVAGTLLRWLASKELRRARVGQENLSGFLPAEEGLLSSSFARGGFHEVCASSYLRTEAAFAEEEGDLPRYWSLEYVERDAGDGYRFWVTEVGISELGADRLVVNARIRTYDDPTYIYEAKGPERNAPRFVRDLILAPGIEVTCGGLPLRTSAIVLTQDNFDLFVEQLIDPNRTAPLVVVSRHVRKEGDEPTYPVDPLKLARLLAGVAVVYALDRNDAALEESYRYVFDNPNKPAYKYRLVPGCLRIFWRHVDLDTPLPFDYARHRFFTAEALETMGANVIIQNISAGVSRMFSLMPGEVLSAQNVSYQASLMRMQRIEQNRKALTERLRDAEGRRAALERELESAGERDGSLDAYRDEIDLLNELLAMADEENRELLARQGRGAGGVSEEEYQLQVKSLEQAERDVLDAEERAESLRQDNGHLRYRVEQLEAAAAEAQADMAGSQAMAELFLEVGKELRDPRKVIEVAEQAFASRLVMLDEARASASDFKGDAGEMFEGLAALYKHLWPLRFGSEGGTAIDEDEFQARSGFEISFHESKQTNKDTRLVRLRQRSYRGELRDMTPHLKGGDKKRGFLRIHFCFDDERKLIVVGHCGGHLETYGTQRR